jgi:hypothetical protein
VVGWAAHTGSSASGGDSRVLREGFDVATEDGSLLRVYFDRLEHRWFVDGIYD